MSQDLPDVISFEINYTGKLTDACIQLRQKAKTHILFLTPPTNQLRIRIQLGFKKNALTFF